MRSDDLVPLMTKSTGKAVSFRQGVIVSWNQLTAENTVMVGGALMENLAILNTSEAAILAPGDVVSILTAGSTWGILGRMTIPGTPEAVSSLSALRFQSDTVEGTDSITSTTLADAPTNPGPTVEITVGPTGRLLVMLTAEFSGQSNSTAAGNTMNCGGYMGCELSGANSVAASASGSMKSAANLTVVSSTATIGISTGGTRVRLYEGLNSGLTTITGKYARQNYATLTSVNVYSRNITAWAI